MMQALAFYMRVDMATFPTLLDYPYDTTQQPADASLGGVLNEEEE